MHVAVLLPKALVAYSECLADVLQVAERFPAPRHVVLTKKDGATFGMMLVGHDTVRMLLLNMRALSITLM